jgi:dolichol-phosphate mannosyltransferase
MPALAFSLVLPTYNERPNLGPLLARVTAALAGHRYEVIVVDDDSPDGTAAEAERLAERYPQLRVIRRVGVRGLGSAVLEGFRAATGEVVGVMDADLQHDEAVLPRLLEAAPAADFVVASRGVVGASVGRWSWHRRLVSGTATLLARVVADVPFSDPLSGFFALRRSLFQALDDGTLQAPGFKILLYLYDRARRHLGRDAVRVREVGFQFRCRLHGESKLTARVVWEFVTMLRVMSGGTARRFLKFAYTGLQGVVVNTALLWLLHRQGLPYLLAGALAIEVAILHNFVLNSLWTFRGRGAGTTWRTRLLRFQAVSLVGLGINLGTLAALHGGLGLGLLVSHVTGIALAAAYNFSSHVLWTWHPGAAARPALDDAVGVAARRVA